MTKMSLFDFPFRNQQIEQIIVDECVFSSSKTSLEQSGIIITRWMVTMCLKWSLLEKEKERRKRNYFLANLIEVGLRVKLGTRSIRWELFVETSIG